MSSFGVTGIGIDIKTIEDILEELSDDQITAFGPSLNTTPASVVGQINSVVGDKLAELWELAEAVYASQYPDTAQGASLDGVVSITGAERQPASQSTVTLRLNLDPGITLNVGRVVSLSSSNERFVTDAAVSNVTGVKANVSVAATAEEYGPVLGSSGTIDTIETPVSGWTAQAGLVSGNLEPFALSNGETLEFEADEGATQTVTFVTGDFAAIGAALATEVADVINDNSTGVEAIAAGGTVFLQSDTDGPGSSIQVTGGTGNAVLGFDAELAAGMNDADAGLGVDLETDLDLRIRREQLIRLAGAGTVDALRAALLDIDNVVQAFVFENETLVTDANGIPGKAFEVVILGGTDSAIAQVIFDQKPLGVQSYRDPGANGVTVVINDSQGVPHNIKFTRATEVRMYIEVDVTANLSGFGGGEQEAGEQAVKDALVLLGDQQIVGETVYIERFRCAPFDVTGVVDVPTIKIEDTSPPTNTANIALTVREIAVFDTSDIVVNTTSV